MKILFLLRRMPGQFVHMAKKLADDPNNQIVFLSAAVPDLTRPRFEHFIPGIIQAQYSHLNPKIPDIHPHLYEMQEAILHGEGVWKEADALKKRGFYPDLVVSHGTWGEGMFLKDIYPEASLLHYFEYYYDTKNSLYRFPVETENLTDEDRRYFRVKNALNLMSLEACDWAYTPTFFQRAQFPEHFHKKMTVLHDGIDTDMCRPLPGASLTLPSGKVVSKGDEIVTFVASNLEPYRGFPTFMRAIEKVLKIRPQAEILIVGGGSPCYGKPHPSGKSYKEVMLEELKLDLKRVHFLGPVTRPSYTRILQASSVHVYFTVPFVLSWSLMEAMAMECLIIASDTQPVRELITNGEEGFLVDFFSYDELASKIDELLAARSEMKPICRQARKKIVREYSVKKLFPYQKALLEDLASGKIPPPSQKKIVRMHRHFGHSCPKEGPL